ncbi:hypothetical protein L0156_10350 [bacterium]|nr:hypothetical protein [bacterium]
MSEPVVIIFTNGSDATRKKFLSKMNCADFGDARDKSVIAIATSGARYIIDSDPNRCPDIILVIDSANASGTEIGTLLAKLIPTRSVCAAYHSRTRERNENLLRSLFKERLVYEGEYHSNSGPAFEGMGEIADALERASGYEDALRKLLEGVFPFDARLETKLELLHRCLTPDGARNVVAGEFPNDLRAERNNLWLKKLLDLNASIFQRYAKEPFADENNKWSVEDLVCALAGSPKNSKKLKDCIDCFDPGYMAALSALRDALLPDRA